MDSQNSPEEKDFPRSHAELMRMIDQNVDQTTSNVNECKTDRDYYDGKQLSSQNLEKLRQRGQPPLAINKISPAIRGMLGILDAAESDPEAFPRTVSSRDAADLATKVLRYLSDKAGFKTVKEECSSNMLIEGCCAAQVSFEDGEIKIEAIRWEDFVYDPMSKKHDFSDAKFLGVAKLMPKSDIKAMFPEFDGDGRMANDFFDFKDDSPRASFWNDARKSLVRVCDLFFEYRGEWHRAIFTGSQILWAGPSGYNDEEGRSICPIVATSWEVSRTGDRVGAIRDMRPLQDELNARRSKMLHLTNNRRVQQTEQAAEAAKKQAVTEAARADGAMPWGWEAVPASDMAQGQMLLMQQTSADLDRLAPTPAVLNSLGGANQSGRARQVLQQAGYTELSRAFGRFETFQLGIYRKLWMCARQHLSEPMMIRIADDPRAIDFMMINEPVMGMVQQPVIDPESGQPVIDPATGQPAIEVKMGVVGMNNRLAELDMDIILSTVPDTVTLQQESFAALLEYATGLRMSPLQPEFQLMIEMSPLPNKREILETIEAFRSKMSEQAPDPMQIEAQKIGLESQRAEIAKDRAKAIKDLTAAQAQKAQFSAPISAPNINNIM